METGNYRLRPDLLENWKELEYWLLALETALVHITPPGKNPWNLEFKHYSLPSSYRYQREHPTQDSVMQSARRSRNAFRGLIASIRMYIAINPQWYSTLHKRFGVPESWLDELSRCIMADHYDTIFPDCVRAFVDMGNLDSLSVVKKQIDYGMPIWIVWGSPNDLLLHYSREGPIQTYWEDFHPRPHELKSLHFSNELADAESSELNVSLRETGEVPSTASFFDSDGFGDARLPIDKASQTLPLYNGSGQRPGDTPYKFVERRREELERRIKNEDQKARDKRLARARNAAKKMRPGARGAACFQWVEVGKGQFVREPIPRSDVESE